MKLGHWPKVPEKLHIYPLSTPWVEIEVIFTLRGAVSEISADFQIAIFGHETCPLAKFPEVAHIPSFYPRWSKLSLFSLYGQRFPKYDPIFKIAMPFGHETWQVAKVPEVAQTLSPQVGEIELIFALQVVVFKIWADFQNCHIWA